MNLLALSFAVSIGLGLITLKAALPDMTAWIRDAMLRIEPMAMDVLEGFVR
jgi:ABC-type Na+ efflux pump permease subunit